MNFLNKGKAKEWVKLNRPVTFFEKWIWIGTLDSVQYYIHYSVLGKKLWSSRWEIIFITYFPVTDAKNENSETLSLGFFLLRIVKMQAMVDC
jgi:hypothetical protein